MLHQPAASLERLLQRPAAGASHCYADSSTNFDVPLLDSAQSSMEQPTHHSDSARQTRGYSMPNAPLRPARCLQAGKAAL